jgi:hypothetical protein
MFLFSITVSNKIKFILKRQNKFRRYFAGHLEFFAVFQKFLFLYCTTSYRKHCLNTLQVLTAVLLKNKVIWDVTSEQECLLMKKEAKRPFEKSVDCPPVDMVQHHK